MQIHLSYCQKTPEHVQNQRFHQFFHHFLTFNKNTSLQNIGAKKKKYRGSFKVTRALGGGKVPVPSFCTYFQRPEPSPGEVGVPHVGVEGWGGGETHGLLLLAFWEFWDTSWEGKPNHLSEITAVKN